MKFFKRFFKKKQTKFTGFEVKLWEDGKLLSHSVSRPDDTMVYIFPGGAFLKTSNGNILTGYNLVPHLERI